jgi:hypothetical protein
MGAVLFISDGGQGLTGQRRKYRTRTKSVLVETLTEEILSLDKI